MKPHEETWKVEQAWGRIWAIGPIEAGSSEQINCTLEQAYLAAQAPAMARLLLEMIQRSDASSADSEDDRAGLVDLQGNLGDEVRKTLRDAGVLP